MNRAASALCQVARILGVVVLSLLLGEVALRAACSLWPPASQLLTHHRVADDRLGWRFNPDYPDIDRWGFRNPQVPQQVDVLVLGDSQTYGYGVELSQSWPQRLAAHSQRSVYSVACSGYGPIHGLAMFDSLLALQPTQVLAAVYPGNDLFDTYQLVYEHDQLTHLRSADADLQQRIRIAEADEPMASRARTVTRLGRPTWPLRDAARAHSYVFNLIQHATGGSGALGGRSAADWQAQQRRASRYADFLTAFEGPDQARTVFTVPKRLLPQQLSDPRIAEGLRLMDRGLREIALRSRRAGADVAFVWIPTKELVFAPLVDEPSAEFERLVQLETEIQRYVQNIAAEIGVPIIDSLPALRESLTRGNSPYTITADGHPNAGGYDEIARTVSAALPQLASSL